MKLSRLAVLVVVALALLAACQQQDPKDSVGNLQIEIGGLPPGVSATVQVLGPSGYMRSLTQSETLNDLPIGSYSVGASTVTSGDGTYSSQVAGSPASVQEGQTETVTVTYSLETRSYTLDVTLEGNGGGLVTSSPAGINCGSHCSESYLERTTVTLSAAAGSDSTFDGWGGACSGRDDCSVTLDGDKRVTATFSDSSLEADYIMSAGAGAASGATDLQIPGNESVLLLVNLSAAARANEALYLELGTVDAVEMVLYNSAGTAVASSSSDELFLRGTAALGAGGSSPAIEPQVTPARACLGVCIIRNADQPSFYLEVFNRGSASRAVEFYAYTASYSDEYEFTNNTLPGAIGIGGGENSANSGAIEYLGDQDYWKILQSGSLFFDPVAGVPSVLDLRLDHYDQSGAFINTHSPGASITVLVGDVLVAYEEGGDAAGPAGSSLYFLEVQ